MSENKKLNTTVNINYNKKYKKYIKLIMYIVLTLLLLLILVSIYLKVKSFIDSHSGNHEHNNISYENRKVYSPEKYDSINPYVIEELLKNQQNFQKEVYQKFEELNNKINILNTNKGDNHAESNDFISDNKVYNIPKKDNSKDLNIVFNLIMDLSTNAPFLTDLDAFCNSGLLEKKSPDIEALYDISANGIPTNYDLVTSLETLLPSLKREMYSKSLGWLNKVKYYLSFFIVVQKECALSCTNNTLDSNLSKIKQLLLENKPEGALKIVDEINLSQLNVLNSWYKDLTYRVKANKLSLKLKQYFLNS